jgi:DNA-binding transcriptional LysR family regulator
MTFKRGHLLYFVTVAEQGQITSAARRLQIAQPALSRAIAQLESDLGFRLLKRHARGVTLTPAGEAFLQTARVAVSAWSDAVASAQSMSRVRRGALEFGFLGVPPGLDSPGILAAFARAYPDIDIRYRELQFPSARTSAWLGDVDVAACHLPPADREVWVQVLRTEPRVVLAPARHRLAALGELSVAEVIDETFVSFHPAVAREWAGFWSLDDHRGGPPAQLTTDGAANPHEVLAALAVRQAITTVPASVAPLIANAMSGVVAVPLSDGAHATIALVGHEDRANPLAETMLRFAGGSVDVDVGSASGAPSGG